MSCQLKPEHVALLDKIANSEGMGNYTIETKTGGKIGYLSRMLFVLMRDDKKQLYLVVKLMPESEFHNLKTDFLFEVEIFIYDTLLREFQKFAKEEGMLHPNLNTAKYYGQCGTTCLVLEDLKSKGYVHYDAKQSMDTRHMTLAMKQYAKFHSISLAMKKKRPDLFERLVNRLKDIRGGKASRDFGMFIKNILEISFTVAEGNEKATKIARKLTEMSSRFSEIVSYGEDDHVILHGDCHSNNIFFKHGDKCTTVSIIDWQISNLGSPVNDLSYFFLSSSGKENLYRYKEYLKIYHDELSKNLREMFCDPEEIFPFSQLELHWKKVSLYGLYFTILVIKLKSLDEDLLIEENTGGDFYKQFDVGPANIDAYKDKVLDVMFFMENEGFIWS